MSNSSYIECQTGALVISPAIATIAHLNALTSLDCDGWYDS
jgi:hypothetical protein